MADQLLQVSYIQPNVAGAQMVTIIKNLSSSNGDHSTNDLAFTHDGKMLICVGSQTNAGIPGALGYLPVRA